MDSHHSHVYIWSLSGAGLQRNNDENWYHTSERWKITALIKCG